MNRLCNIKYVLSEGYPLDAKATPTKEYSVQVFWTRLAGFNQGFSTPLFADLFLLCYERDFMLSLSGNNQVDVVDIFNSTSKYLDNLLNIDNT